MRRLARGLLSWASFACIPIGMVVVVSGFQTLGGLLIVGGILAYFLVDPIMFLLDLVSPKGGDTEGERSNPARK
ncbi:MAG: hypothetical protein HY576_08255 [candidate division NC10 bacterium]|nr:hypothetical protein [candidate division NC10 bacterium]